jgi:hypothetical protein
MAVAEKLALVAAGVSGKAGLAKVVLVAAREMHPPPRHKCIWV